MAPGALTVSLAVTMFALIAIWFALLKTLFNRLERTHPAKYESMGKPSLFLRNNLATGWATLKFLFAREHRNLNDPKLSKLSDFMLVFLSAYLIMFIGVSVWAANQSGAAA